MSQSNNNVSILGLLGVAFVVLKLTGIIGWSWWLVTMPLWLGFAIVLIAMVLIAWVTR